LGSAAAQRFGSQPRDPSCTPPIDLAFWKSLNDAIVGRQPPCNELATQARRQFALHF
jgi:hypothetical protein